MNNSISDWSLINKEENIFEKLFKTLNLIEKKIDTLDSKIQTIDNKLVLLENKLCTDKLNSKIESSKDNKDNKDISYPDIGLKCVLDDNNLIRVKNSIWRKSGRSNIITTPNIPIDYNM
jgi:hypothetical protein